ncbi:MAG: hypothetical protein R2780_12800 [Crocinitomicaceae bacterium]
MRSIILIIFFIPLASSALDELPDENSWLNDFVKQGLRSAYSKWTYTDPADYNREEIKVSYYDFESNSYHFEFSLKHTADWSVVTKNGTVDPPKMVKHYASSKVSQWTNFEGKGSYTENYERAIPNWLYFVGMDSLLVMLSQGKVDPAINKLLWSDEQKLIKKLYAAKKSTQAYIWNQFLFDHKDDIIGINTEYLIKNGESRKFDSRMTYEMYIENKQGDRLKFIPYSSSADYAIIDGVQVSINNRKAIYFNESLNKKLHRFSPEVFRNPQKVINSFLLALQEASGKVLERLSVEE